MAKWIEALLEAPSAGSPKEDAAQDLIEAVKDGDAAAVATAFATLYELCAGGGEEEESDDEEEAEEVYGG
jgi:hypothetical protein